MTATFTFGEHLYKHLVGDPACEEGWCGGYHGYPKPCDSTPDCEGLVHADFGDENMAGDYWLFTACDVCGEAE